MVVIIIQAGLSYADDARMGCALDQLRGIDMRMLVRLMRMDADGRPDVWFAQRGVQHIVPLAFACGDVEHQSDAGATRPFEHILLILDQPLVIQVAMAVDEHITPLRRAVRGAGKAAWAR